MLTCRVVVVPVFVDIPYGGFGLECGALRDQCARFRKFPKLWIGNVKFVEEGVPHLVGARDKREERETSRM